MNIETLKEKAADAEAEAQRAAKAFKAAPDQKTHSAKDVAAQLAENAREALAAAEQQARDVERAGKLKRLGDMKRAASVATLLRDCNDDIAAIVKAEQLVRDAVTRLADRVAKHSDIVGAAYTLANELGTPIGDLEARAQEIKMVDVFALQAEVQRALRDKYTGSPRGFGLTVGIAVGAVGPVNDWLVF